MTPARAPDQGVILINVLVILALSSTILFAMLRLSDAAISRSQRFSDAAQGVALLDAGEVTGIAALRRDMQAAPQADFPGEDWASIGQEEIAIAGGTFSLAIMDATGKFNLTNVVFGGPETLPFLQKILDELALSDTARLQLLTRLANPAPLTAMDDLRASGLSPADIRQLSTLVTVLPNPTAINLNTMPDAMFNVLAGNPVQARLLQGLRARRGQIAPSDLLDAGLIPAVRVAVTSDIYTVTTHAMIGDVRQARESLLVRSVAPTGPQVIVVARRAVE